MKEQASRGRFSKDPSSILGDYANPLLNKEFNTI
jgi:hypothetical protein